jgi:hypothetical protein
MLSSNLAKRSFFRKTREVGQRLTGEVRNYFGFVIVGENYATMIHRF